MPLTTRADDESGFIGLTVVLALRNEKIPIPATAMPMITAPTAQMRRAGKANLNAGAAQAVHHINPPVRSTRARGGTFNSKRCMGSIQFLRRFPASFRTELDDA